MNRKQRRAEASRTRKAEQSLPTWSGPVPEDIKRDIAKVVRSVDLADDGSDKGGCFFRAMVGWVALMLLGIAAKPALGGMVYRAGPDEYSDVVAFCGEGNVGRQLPDSDAGLLGHFFLVSGNNLVDFSVRDWKEQSRTPYEYVPPGSAKLAPVNG
jgi:hypothetical protein